VFPQRKHLPVRLRLWMDFLRDAFSRPGFGLEEGAPV